MSSEEGKEKLPDIEGPAPGASAKAEERIVTVYPPPAEDEPPPPTFWQALLGYGSIFLILVLLAVLLGVLLRVLR